MPAQVFSTVENNFTKGLITESTGLNFPENAATDTDNCIYTLVGDVTRRYGLDYENNFQLNNLVSSSAALTSYKWNNAGGDGQTQIVVCQIGTMLFFYKSSAVTTNSSLSKQILSSTVLLPNYQAQNGTSFDPLLECQYADGNGYLFVFHPNIDPIYVQYNPSTDIIVANSINVQIRDFNGIVETGVSDTFRSTSITTYHNYNLINQGWGSSPTWNYTSFSPTGGAAPGGVMTFSDVPAGTGAHVGDPAIVSGGFTWQSSGGPITSTILAKGTVTSFSGSVMQITVASVNVIGTPYSGGFILNYTWYVQQGASANYATVWKTALGTYPSNADVWWRFKDTTGAFNPGATVSNVTLSSPAPKGHVILSAFNQTPEVITGIPGLGTTSTAIRPSTGAWFQGRLWFAGCNASASSTGPFYRYYSWSENIYFSQVCTNVSDTAQFGKCYQVNDPTSEDLFDLLPTDGGSIIIPGSGSIYKLFPIQNGLIVFAANGVWFITGSQGIGFSANDYTIVKLSEVKSISGSSFVNVLGLPYFWNEEGIYKVYPMQNGSLTVEPITVGTILRFYNEIPVYNRRFAKGAYDPIEYTISWVYRSTPETTTDDRYSFNRVLNYNTYNKAFFPYTFSGNPKVGTIVYISSPGGSSAPEPVLKYFVKDPTDNFTFAEERDTSYLDFKSYDNIGVDFTSYFVTGYKLRGQAIMKFQPVYVNVYTRTNGAISGYKFQVLWDFSNNLNSNRWSTIQVAYITDTNYDTLSRRHKARGRGYALQFKIASITGQPFDIQGWAVVDVVNASV